MNLEHIHTYKWYVQTRLKLEAYSGPGQISKMKLFVESINDLQQLVVRACRQITFVTFKGFCPLSKKPPLPVLNGQYQVEWNTKQK